jgi:dipeptidyl aminopeptidase/acylaminoacyl peptidase
LLVRSAVAAAMVVFTSLLLAPPLAAEETSTAAVVFAHHDYYGNGDEIMVANPDGSGLHVLMTGREPNVSPDGTRIAAWDYDDIETTEASTLTVFDVQRERTVLSLSDAKDPSWSPNGRKIVFIRLLDQYGEIFTMDADGSRKRNLSQHPLYSSSRSGYSEPVWSAEGKIAFTRYTESDGRPRVYVMDASPAGDQVPVADIGSFDPSWNATGSRLAIACCSGGVEDTEIYLIDRDGSNPVQVTHNNDADSDPSWASDGRLYYISESDVHVRVLGRRGSRRLTCESEYGVSYSSPSFRSGTWSPQRAGERRADTDMYVNNEGRSARDNRRVVAQLKTPRGPCDPPRDTCLGGRRVVVKELRDGDDRVVGRGRTNDAGRMSASVEQRRGRFYAVVDEKRYTSPVGRPVHCLPERTPAHLLTWE